MEAEKTEPDKPKTAKAASDQFGPWMKENFEAIVIAFIMALVIRCFCIEVFKIPSSSMEPYLLGDFIGEHGPKCDFPHYHDKRPSGDRIMVTKYFYALRNPARYDVAVFRFPLNQSRNFIKRITGVGPEQFFLEGGNVYRRETDSTEKRFAIARKPEATQNEIWIDVVDQHNHLDPTDNFTEYWRKSNEEDAGDAGYEIRDRKLTTIPEHDSRSLRLEFRGGIQDGYQDVGEVRLAFGLELLEESGRFYARVQNEFGTFKVILSATESSVLEMSTGKDGKETVKLPVGRLEVNRRYEVDLQIYDGLVQVYVDGALQKRVEFIQFHDEIPRDGDDAPVGAFSHVSFGSRDLLFSVDNLTLGRDLYYRTEGKHIELEGKENAISIPDGQYLMMGDNVENSHDSRAWMKHTFRLKDGRVIEAESQNVVEKGSWNSGRSWEDHLDEIREQLPEGYVPDFIITADLYGNFRWFRKDELQERLEAEHYSLIERRYLIGRAFWVWWPPGRAFRLIR